MNDENIELFKALLTEHDTFVLCTHAAPDGDALGAEYAMYHLLQHYNKNIFIINPDPPAQKFVFIDKENIFNDIDSNNPINEQVDDFVFLLLDTNDTKNIGLVSSRVLPRAKKLFIIDHHELTEEINKNNMINPAASSTSEIIHDLFVALDIPITMDIARALYLGIMYDTGSFIYPKTTAHTFKIAYKMVLTGVDPNEIYMKVYESNSISSLVLRSKVLSTLEFHFNQRIAIQTMLLETIKEAGARYEEADTLINTPLKCGDIRVSIFFKQDPSGRLRCSLRSKGNINVARIAQHFGGGGHKTASGFKCSEPLEITREKVLNMLREYF